MTNTPTPMRKTAMQQLIKEINQLQRIHPDQHQYDLLERIAKNKLSDEREQIEEAAEYQTEKTGMTGSDYYTQTYNTDTNG